MRDANRPTFRRPEETPRQKVLSDYCAYIAYHEQRKEAEEKQPKSRGYRPLSKRFSRARYTAC
jgi:hypothetical protein